MKKCSKCGQLTSDFFLGLRVRITFGPFEGMEGVIEEHDRERREFLVLIPEEENLLNWFPYHFCVVEGNKP